MNKKEVAIALRKQGLSYPQIVKEMKGEVSLSWCKHNLKGIEKSENLKECIDELIFLATRKEGVSLYEANGVIMKYHPDKELNYNQLKYIRDKAKLQNEECLFRPGWISVDEPVQSYDSFLTYVVHIQDEIDNVVRWYCDTYPTSEPKSVMKEIMYYINGNGSEPLSSRISRTESLIDDMINDKTID